MNKSVAEESNQNSRLAIRRQESSFKGSQTPASSKDASPYRKRKRGNSL